MKQTFDVLSEECSKITTQHYSTSFSLAIYLLSKEIRNPIYSIYGFVRLADEIVDSFHDYDKKYLLDKFKKDCFESIDQRISLNPVLNSFQKVVNEYQIEHRLIELFLKSMEMDLERNRYTPEMYDEYILGSAQAVGLMCLQVFTAGNKEEYEHLKIPAMKLGAAFQKVNFLRDVQADYKTLDRTYFPDVDLTAFSNAEKRIIERDIEKDFAEALIGIKQLPVAARSGVYLAYVYYKQLFNKIKRTSADRVFLERIRISNFQKFGLMCDSLIRYKLNAL
ncbi:MAG TPA: phytoene/squalene synthase family protein [Cyclobacteriaceae bacterium]